MYDESIISNITGDVNVDQKRVPLVSMSVRWQSTMACDHGTLL